MGLLPEHPALQHERAPRPLPLFLELVRAAGEREPELAKEALVGLRAYQDAPASAGFANRPVVAAAGSASLRDHGGKGPPVVLIPSLINPPRILDLDEETSLTNFIASSGRRALLVDWGPAAGRRDLGVAQHVEQLLLPLLAALDEPPVLVGYCLGGTMAVAAAPLIGAPATATIAAPWHFDGFDDQARRLLSQLWAGSKGAAGRLGMLPMEALQSAFWNLDPARTVSKFERFADLDPLSREAQAFVTLEDWSNDGPPVPYAAAREMFEGFFEQDLPGNGRWQVAGGNAQHGATRLLNIVSTSDRIVPAATAPRAGDLIELSLGHVGMVVGSRAREALWEPLDRWLSQARPSC